MQAGEHSETGLRHDNKGQTAQLASHRDSSSLAKTTKGDFCLDPFFQGLLCCLAPDLAIDLKRKKDCPTINFSTQGLSHMSCYYTNWYIQDE